MDDIVVVDDRHDGEDEDEEATEASPSSSSEEEQGGGLDEDGSPSAADEQTQQNQLSYALLNLTEQRAWDNTMSQLVSLEKETAAYWDSPRRIRSLPRFSLLPDGDDSDEECDQQEDEEILSIEDLRRQLQAFCELIETHPRLFKVHDDSEESTTPCLLQRVCLGGKEWSSGRYSVLGLVHVTGQFEIVKRLIDLNPEALLWTKVRQKEGEGQEPSLEAAKENTPILKDLLKKFPQLGLFIFEQHRSIFDSKYQDEPVANLVTGIVCRIGRPQDILPLVGKFSPERLLFPIQVVTQRVHKKIYSAMKRHYGDRIMNEADYEDYTPEAAIGTLDMLNRSLYMLKPEMVLVLVFLLKGSGQCVQLLQQTDQYSAAFSLMWCSLLYPSRHTQGYTEKGFTEKILGTVTTIILQPLLSKRLAGRLDFAQFASHTMLVKFIIGANEKARRCPSMFKFLKTILRILRVSGSDDFSLVEHVLKKDVVSHLIPLIDQELEIVEQEYVKLRRVRTMISKSGLLLGSEKEEIDEESNDSSPLVGFMQALDGWTQKRLEGCPPTSHPRIRALRVEMNQIPPKARSD